MDNNPIDFNDLFNFNDLSSIEKGVNGISALKKAYTDFFNTVVGGQLDRLTVQEKELQAANKELVTATEKLSAANKDHQKTLLDNLKIAQQLKDAQDKLKKAREDAKKTDDVASSAVKSLTQQYKDLKRAYEQALLAGDSSKMDAISKSARELDANIKTMNTTLKATKEVFTAAAGSYDALNQRNKELLAQLRAMPGGFTSTSKEAKALRAEIATGTQQLKDYDKQIGQNFRNVGNYASAFNGLKNQFTSFAAGYLSLTAAFGLLSHVVDVNKQISDSMADVQRTASLTEKEVSDLVESLKKIDTRTSLQGLLAIAVIGGQLGIAKNQLAGFTKSVDELAVVLAGEIPGGAEAIATALGKINGVFKTQQKEGTDAGTALQKTGSAILALGQAGLATGGFLQDFTQRVAGTADVAKLSLPVILGYAATLEETGSSAEVGATAFNRLIGALASKKDKFFAVAQIADSKLTIESFTKLIKEDANLALQKFFQGLNKGGTDLISFNTLLADLNIKAGPARNSIIELAKNQGILNTRIDEATDAYNKGTLASEQFKIKNDNLAGSVAKLSNEFDNDLQGGGIGKFFKAIVDGARGALSGLEALITRVADAKGVFGKLGAITANASGAVEIKRLNTAFDSSDTVRQKLPDNVTAKDIAVDAFSISQLKDLFGQYDKAYKQALGAYQEFKIAIKAGVVSDPNGDLKKYAALTNTLFNQTNAVATAYKKARDENVNFTHTALQGVKELTDAQLTSIPQIKARIKELTALPDSGVLGSDSNLRINALKDRLKELNGTTKETKDGFAALEEQIKKTADKLQDSVINDNNINNGRASKETIKLADSYNKLIEKLKLLKDAQAQAQINAAFGKNGQAPVLEAARGPELDAGGLADALRSSYINRQINSDLAALDNLNNKYTETNLKILKSYKDRNITIEQYNEQTLNADKAQQYEAYTLQSKILQNRLLLVQKGSKEEISIKQQIAALDLKYGKEQIANAEEVEKKRIQAIQNIFTYLSKSIQPLSDELGRGFGDLFSVLTSQLEKFAIDGKENLTDVFETAGGLANAFTQIFTDGSNARITQLETERDASLSLAGNNADAKAAIEKRYNKEIAAEKRKAAIAQKIDAIFQIGINTAIAVLKVTGQTGIAAPFIIPGIIALGALEAGLVAAKPIPKFYKGRTGGPKTLGVVNDRGTELLEHKGSFRIAGGGAETTTVLREGEKVHTAEQTKAILGNIASNQFVDSLIEGTSVMRSAESARNKEIALAIANTQLNQRSLVSAFKEAIAEQNIFQTIIDENGFHDYTTKQNQRITKQDQRRKGGNG